MRPESIRLVPPAGQEPAGEHFSCDSGGAYRCLPIFVGNQFGADHVLAGGQYLHQINLVARFLVIPRDRRGFAGIGHYPSLLARVYGKSTSERRDAILTQAEVAVDTWPAGERLPVITAVALVAANDPVLGALLIEDHPMWQEGYVKDGILPWSELTKRLEMVRLDPQTANTLVRMLAAGSLEATLGLPSR